MTYDDAAAGAHGPTRPVRRHASGTQLMHASWALLRQDRELLWLPVLGAVFAVLAAVILAVPGVALGALADDSTVSQVGYWVALALALFAATCVSIFFQTAVVIGANERAEGRDPTRSLVLREAWKRKGRILKWSALTTTVGLLLRVIQDRLGAAGAIIGALGGLAWGVVSFLVVPVLVTEDVGPVSAVKRSATLLKETWGTSLRTTLRFGWIALVLWLPTLAVVGLGVWLLLQGGTAADATGAGLLVLGVFAGIVLATVFSAVGGYARALIYRYATGQATPGVEPRLLAGAFRSR
jgi:Family of unknown function (DUF6159)